MLNYLGEGARRYGLTPFAANQRGRWEFQAVVSGAIGMTGPGLPDELRRQTLWLSGPEHVHGWTGRGQTAASVVVFHFLAVPEPLRRLVRDDAVVEIALTAAACRRLRELAKQAMGYWKHPSAGMVMCYEHVLLELSLLVYETLRGAKKDVAAENDRRVSDALRWYARQIESNPSLADVARAVNVSPSHLRRLFHEVLQAAPKPVFDGLRFQRAVQLMADPGVKLSTVSVACGFESQSAFSRAFKAKFGCAPEVWRG